MSYNFEINKKVFVYRYTRLLGCFAPIFYFLCKHLFFEIKYMEVLLVNKTKTKNFTDLKKNSADFKIFKSRTLMEAIF